MVNRFTHLITYSLFACTLLMTSNLQAQFIFDYSGPDTFYLDNVCTAPFDFGGQPPTVTSSIGANIVTPPTGVDPILTGYTVGGLVNNIENPLTVYFIAEDDAIPVNRDTFIFDIYFLDNTPPTFSSAIPDDVVVDCVEDIPPPVDLTAIDNCVLISFDVTPTDNPANPTANCTGSPINITRTWEAVDASGNTAIATQVITLLPDVQGPNIGQDPEDGIFDCQTADFDAWLATQTAIVENSITENCTYTLTNDAPPGYTGDCGSIVVTFTVTDACGQTDMASATYEVVDNGDPLFSGVPADLTLDCTETVPSPANVTASDDCDTNFLVVNFEEVSTQTMTGECTDYSYTITRTWSATDACGNMVDTTQIITVTDELTPTFTLPPDTTLSCEVDPITQITGIPSGPSDNCTPQGDLALNFTDEIDTLSCSQNLLIHRIWTLEDVCGNIAVDTQLISIVDTVAPTYIAPPDTVFVSCNEVNNIGITGSPNNVVENCGIGSFFFINQFYNQTCVNSYNIRRLWILEDDCGNADTTIQILIVRDTVPPEITEPAQNLTITCTTEAEAEIAFLNWVSALGFAQANDDCSDANLSWNAYNTGTLDNPMLPLANCSNVQGVYRTQTVDFVVSDECGNESTTTATFSVTDDLPPQIISCPNNTVVSTDFDQCSALVGLPPAVATENCGAVPVTMEYSVNDGPRISMDPISGLIDTFEEGENVIDYFVIDCAGNESTCTFLLTVEDDQAPEIDCPVGFSLDTEVDLCEATTTFPLPISVSDNCGAESMFSQEQPTTGMEQMMTFALNAVTGSYVAEDKTFTFNNVPASATSDVILTVKIRGDIDELGEYFQIKDPNGASLGITEIGQPNVVAGDCNVAGQATFVLPAAYFNSIVNNGMVTFTAEANTTFTIPVSPDDGINPCNPGNVGQDGDVDGQSLISMTLDIVYEEFIYYTEGATVIPPTAITDNVAPEHTLGEGITTVYYVVSDIAGNADTCFYEIDVVDNQDPDAECQPSIITINPSGFDEAEIMPVDLDAGSTDNCGVDSMYVVAPIITCDMIGDTMTVQLFVLDGEGNSDFCNSLVKVEGESPAPTYYIDDCGSDTLFLFANPPMAPGPNVWSYTWTGPSSFSSTQQNPIIINAGPQNAGTYTVTIEGFTDCTSFGEVQVAIDDLPVTPEIDFESASICEDEDIEMFTDPVPSGGSVQYVWYSGDAPNGVQIGSTITPAFNYAGPHMEGDSSFYVVVIRNGCVSNPSASQDVTITAPPTALVDDDQIDICEGGLFSLGTPVSGPGITYSWSGPQAFSSDAQYPPDFTDVTLGMDGTYTLIISENGCESDPVFTVVNVLPRPPGPIISNSTSISNPACAGEAVTLVTNVTNGTSYEWTGGQGLLTFVTDTNILVIDEVVQGVHNGIWQVTVFENVCPSEASDPGTEIFIENLPLVDANSNSPICDNEALELTASFINGASYQWTGPDGMTYSGNQPTPIDDALAGEYSLIITSANFCESTDTISVVVNESPELISVSNDAPPCPQGPTDVNLFHTVFPEDDGSYQYAWTDGFDYFSNSPDAFIPGATEADNGGYTLIVTNGFGCESNELETTVNMGPILANPPTPVLDQANPFCEGESVTISVTDIYTGTLETFNWITPTGGILPETDPFITIDPLDASDAGMYRVIVEVDGCLTDTSGGVNLVVNPIPVVTAISNSPVCEGDIIQLEFSDCFDGEVVEYQWTGPAGISSSICNPIVGPATTNNTGTYTGLITVNGCQSTTVSTNVIVNEAPSVPVVSNSGAVCLGDDEAELTLFIQPASATPGATYSWFNNGLPLGTSGGALVFTVTDFSDFTPGLNTITAVAELNTCESSPSVPTSVQLDTIPANNADAGLDQFTCEDEPATLLATPPTVGTGMWTLVAGNPSGVTITNPTSPTTSVQGLTEGSIYTFAWTLSNGACSGYSVDSVDVTVDFFENSNAGEDIDTCGVTSVVLNSTPPDFGEGMWSQPVEQELFGVVIVDPFDPNTVINGLEPGNVYIFFWTLLDNGCGEEVDEVLVQVVEDFTFAGDDYPDCGEGCTELAALAPDAGFGTWSSPDGEINFSDPNDPDALACNLVEGENLFIWTINDGVCGDSGRDTVFVDYKYLPEAINDTLNIPFAGSGQIDLGINDAVPSESFFNILNMPENGTITEVGDGIYEYQANINFVGQDVFQYELCSENCDCSTALIVIGVGDGVTTGDECLIPTIITPNDDGINDAFVIPCLASSTYPDNRVSIFNQWGDEVYQSAPYANDWKGTYDGEDLPTGTYFFIVNLGDGSDARTGFLILQR